MLDVVSRKLHRKTAILLQLSWLQRKKVQERDELIAVCSTQEGEDSNWPRLQKRYEFREGGLRRLLEQLAVDYEDISGDSEFQLLLVLQVFADADGRLVEEFLKNRLPLRIELLSSDSRQNPSGQHHNPLNRIETLSDHQYSLSDMSRVFWIAWLSAEESSITCLSGTHVSYLLRSCR